MGQGVRVSLPYIHAFRDRHGHQRHYFRRRGSCITLPGKPGSVEFLTAYNAALAGYKVEPKPASAGPGSVSGTIAAYYTDNAYLHLAPSTRQAQRAILERFRSECGALPIARLEQKHIAAILGKKKPFAAHNWLKALRGLMAFALHLGLVEKDPTAGLKPAKAKAGSIHTWSEDEIAIYERHHAGEARATLGLRLLLFTAARRSDAIKLGPQHIRGGRLYYRQQKTGRALELPIHPSLATVIAQTPTGHLTFLATPSGTPYTAKGFGKLFRRWCDEAGLPQCSAHGLRKACARRLAEAGCTPHEIMSITGHQSLSQVQRYTDAVRQSMLADEAMKRTR